jgi:hypothetical protein
MSFRLIIDDGFFSLQIDGDILLWSIDPENIKIPSLSSSSNVICLLLT